MSNTPTTSAASLSSTELTGEVKVVEKAGTGTLSLKDGLRYLNGFANTFESESVPEALPTGRNNPRQVPLKLYTEQLTGTAFTAPRKENRRTWLYRIQPSVTGVGPAEPVSATSSSPYPTHFGGTAPDQCRAEINPLRWNPLPLPLPVDNKEKDSQKETDFISGMRLMCQAGDPVMKSGLAIYMYTCQTSMKQTQTNTHFSNADGEFLIVPQTGTLEIVTEVGRMTVAPTEIAVVPRGMVFQVNLVHPEKSLAEANAEPAPARGYVLEVYNATGFQLPELGPIGSNGLANARDFMYPVAWCVADPESYRQSCTIVTKSSSQLFIKTSDHSPYNVVAWHGNYLPYKYDLTKFCAVGSVSYDHLDPSIYTVLTCPTDHVGTAMADFVIFPPRCMATDSNTLRPPWFHRNTMSEFMGMIQGQYDAKKGFLPGGASLHNCMTPHGPDEASYAKAVDDPCENPIQFEGGLAFMFETCLPLSVAPAALEDLSWRDVEYAACWDGLVDDFAGWHHLLAAMKKKE
jgi:homogentisate 1,2-dioxygenase